MEITKHKVASIHYTLKDDSGTTIDSSEGREPLTYLHGAGGLIVGMEEALEGKKKGDQFEVNIPPEKGYGVYDEKKLIAVPRDKFPADTEIKPGMQFQAQGPNGTHVVRVSKVEGDNVMIDDNHQLAGKNLNFKVEVVEVREASKDEVTHGHVHGPGGHHH